jgi:hypothetical protein
MPKLRFFSKRATLAGGIGGPLLPSLTSPETPQGENACAAKQWDEESLSVWRLRSQGSAVRLKTSGSSKRSKSFRRALNAHLDGLPESTPIEIRFQHEAKIGRKN